METWFIYAILSTIFTGFFTFSSKISIEQNYNPVLITFYSMITALICGIILLIYTGEKVGNIWLAILLGLVNGGFYLINNLMRIKSLKYIDSSIFFPIYKTIGPILLLITMILFFQETLSLNEIIGVILGISVPIILIGKNQKSKNIKLGIRYLIIGLIASIIASISSKISSIYNINIILFTIFALLSSTIFTFIIHKKKKEKKEKYSILYIKRIGIVTGLLNFFGFYFFMKAFTLGDNLGVVYTIQSLYIIIPILLSILIYKEDFNMKKFIAIILTITTIFFLK